MNCDSCGEPLGVWIFGGASVDLVTGEQYRSWTQCVLCWSTDEVLIEADRKIKALIEEGDDE